MPIRDLYLLSDEKIETVAVEPHSLKIGWRRVTGRFKHYVGGKRRFHIVTERGRSATVSEDHSLFTVADESGEIVTIRGADIRPGMPLVVPFDLSDAADAWAHDLATLDLREIEQRRQTQHTRTSTIIRGEFISNRLGRTCVPVDFPVTDDFLYIVGLWLAEGGKDPLTESRTLALSIGGIPGAVSTLDTFVRQFGMRVHRSPANSYDVCITSSVMVDIFYHLGLFGTARRGDKRFPEFFWRLSQRQRRVLIAGFWDGDGSHVFNGEAIMAQHSHALVEELYHCLVLDGIFPVVKSGKHEQRVLVLGRAQDFRRFAALYPLRHYTKLESLQTAGEVIGRDKCTGLWKSTGIWRTVAAATVPAGTKTRVYNRGGKYDSSARAQRSAFAPIPALRGLVDSRLAFLRVTSVTEACDEYMYDLAVEGAENFIAGGILAHNSGYPDCRPEYIEAFERMANLATKAGVEGRRLRIHTPLLDRTKAEIIALGRDLGVDYRITVSCYDPAADGSACGRCDSCLLRKKGFAEAGGPDPTRYQETGATA